MKILIILTLIMIASTSFATSLSSVMGQYSGSNCSLDISEGEHSEIIIKVGDRNNVVEYNANQEWLEKELAKNPKKISAQQEFGDILLGGTEWVELKFDRNGAVVSAETIERPRVGIANGRKLKADCSRLQHN